MGIRDVTVFSCDGCRATTTIERSSTIPRGFNLVVLAGRDVILCSVCFGAVEWVARFQGITVPPRVYRDGNRYSLRPVRDE